MLPGEGSLWARDWRMGFVGYLEAQLLLLTVGWFLGRKDPLEEGMATHRRIPAWRIPSTEEPGGPQSSGLQKEDAT